uniref:CELLULOSOMAL ANCHORING SCAFFOLDIN B n=1 Tax=Pseudobacteroides cellulosolvens TaxID=35825 RepID=UPI0006242AC3|nr:Chain A, CELLULOSOMAL ANCHORING SCAFFOLDIN B [Pseudobacteroides cellulosolvens]
MYWMNVVIGKMNAEVGGEVVVPIEFNNVPSFGINNCDFKLVYDATALELKNVEAGDIIKTPLANFSNNKSEEGKISFLFNDASQGSMQIENGGVFAKITFKVKSTTATGVYDLRKDLVGSFSGLKDNKMTSIGAEFTNGSITVAATAPLEHHHHHH